MFEHSFTASGTQSSIVNSREFMRAMKQFPEEAAKECREELSAIGKYLVARINTTRFGSGKEKITIRSGRLARGFKTRIFGKTLDNIGLRIQNRVPYARTHEKGSYTKPKYGKYLWIPSDQIKDARGKIQGKYRRAFRNDKNFMFYADGGKDKYEGKPMKYALMRLGKGKNARTILLFTLTQRVRIPRRLRLRGLVERSERPQIVQKIGDALKRAAEKAGKP